MRIGIMGGTLDPVHNGHIQLAETALKMLCLDRVMLLPAGDPPHKQNPILKTDRLEMAKLAAQESEGLFACCIEVFRCGTTFTVDTLRELHSKNPSTEWFYIIGEDTLEVLDTWRNFDQVAGLCRFIVVGRADASVNPKYIRTFEEKYGASFEILPFNGPDISSTEIRKRAAEGTPIDRLVPKAVGDYIQKKGLYICNCSRSELLERLQSELKPSRYKHTIGVAETAKRLAPRFGIDPVRAEIAALLHDCAKYMPIEDMRSIVKAHIPNADKQEMETISVLHAPAGAVYAWQRYGVSDRNILSAIRRHTLGGPDMSVMDALIYTADFIEPGREPFPGLEEARSLAENDIFAAMYKCAELTNQHLISQGRRPHPRSLDMMNNKNSIQKEETK